MEINYDRNRYYLESELVVHNTKNIAYEIRMSERMRVFTILKLVL